MGFTGVPKNGIVEELGILLNSRSMVAVDPSMLTNSDAVFAAGDCISGPSLVVRAMASGIAVSEKIHNYLTNTAKR